MSFTIRMGIPEMLELWTELSQKNATGTISKIVPVLHTLQIMPIHTTTPYKRTISVTVQLPVYLIYIIRHLR